MTSQGLPNDAYWVEEGRVMAGPYPGRKTRTAAIENIRNLVGAGVTHFIDLTKDRGPDRDELEPYEHLLVEAESQGHRAAGFSRHAITDLGIPTEGQMRNVLDEIQHLVDRGETTYIHCWGGVGRTGTVVGCFLIERGLSAQQAIALIARRRSGLERADRISPETAAQMEFIRSWGSKNVS